jgi:hypothetical protein
MCCATTVATNWKAMAADGSIRARKFSMGACVFLLLSILSIRVSAQSTLDRRITVHAEPVRLSQALELVAKEADCKLSYNADVVPMDSIVSLQVTDQPVNGVLRELLPRHAKWKMSGRHLIITGELGAKQRFTCTGRVVETGSGAPISNASVLDVQRGNVVSTGPNGDFSMEINGELERTPVRIARQGFRDTVVYVPRNADVGRVALSALTRVEYLEPICLRDRCGVEDLGVAKLLVPQERLQQNANLGGGETRNAQLSLIPSVSTNGQLAASTVNKASFNVLGGFARGVDGAEFAGGFNLLSENMRGFQFSGAANLVGGRTRGVQISGGFNHTMGSLYGLQIAGAANTVWDTLSGVQLAGGVNVVKRGMAGTQVAGGLNVTLGDLDGVQVAGGMNVAHGGVHRAQVAGGFNYARSVQGAQVAAGANVSLGDVGGGQVGFGANYAASVSGGQVSFGANVVAGEVSGGQVGFGLNYAHRVTGGQFTFGANVVPGEVTGGQVGFGLNYAHNVGGGQFTFGANVVPNTVQGAQVGVLNFARRALGGQVGILNLSDTLAGGAVGILTISRRGYHRVDLVCTDVLPLAIQVRTGTRSFHNILGYDPPIGNTGRWSYLYGIGNELRLGESWVLDVDLTAEQVQEHWAWVNELNLLGRISLCPGVYVGQRFFISGGPALNGLFSTLKNPETGTVSSTLPPGNPLFTGRLGSAALTGWLGWKVGMGVKF